MILVIFFSFFFLAKDLNYCFFGFGEIDFVICDLFFSVKKTDFVVIFVSGEKERREFFFLFFVCFGKILFVVMCFF